jgi:hypothetical protein
MVYKDKTIGQIVFCTIILSQNFIPMMAFGQTTVHQNFFFYTMNLALKHMTLGHFAK